MLQYKKGIQLWEIVKDKGAWHAAVCGVTHHLAIEQKTT